MGVLHEKHWNPGCSGSCIDSFQCSWMRNTQQPRWHTERLQGLLQKTTIGWFFPTNFISTSPKQYWHIVPSCSASSSDRWNMFCQNQANRHRMRWASLINDSGMLVTVPNNSSGKFVWSSSSTLPNIGSECLSLISVRMNLTLDVSVALGLKLCSVCLEE